MQTIIDRKIAPLTKDIEKINIPHAKKFTLDNGIPVYSINAGFQDLIKIEFIFKNLSFDVSRPLSHSATNRLLSEGTKNYTAQQLADHIDYYGAFFETEENSDFCSVILYTLNKYLETTLPYVNDILFNPLFPEKELELYIQNNKQRLNVENEKVNSLARKKFNNLIFGSDHNYGYYTTTADYDRINRIDLIDKHQDKYVASNCTIIVSGIVKDESIKLLNKYFGGMRNAVAESKENLPQVASEQKKFLVEKEGAIQSAIRIGKPFFNRTNPDYPGMAVLNTVFGGYFGSRLMSNIREEKGYTYGIGSSIVSMKQNGYFFIGTEVGADVTRAAVDEIYYEMNLLKEEEVDDEELEMVRNYMLGTFLKSIDGAFQLAERFKSIYLYDLDYSYYDRYLEKVRTIKPDEIKELANRYFDADSMYEVIAGSK